MSFRHLREEISRIQAGEMDDALLCDTLVTLPLEVLTGSSIPTGTSTNTQPIESTQSIMAQSPARAPGHPSLPPPSSTPLSHKIRTSQSSIPPLASQESQPGIASIAFDTHIATSSNGVDGMELTRSHTTTDSSTVSTESVTSPSPPPVLSSIGEESLTATSTLPASARATRKRSASSVQSPVAPSIVATTPPPSTMREEEQVDKSETAEESSEAARYYRQLLLMKCAVPRFLLVCCVSPTLPCVVSHSLSHVSCLAHSPICCVSLTLASLAVSEHVLAR